MYISMEHLDILRRAIGFALFSAGIAFLWAPLLIKFLYKYNITRRAEYDSTLSLGARKSKAGVPLMGGLVVIITVAVITYFFNWNRSFTWVPIGVMLLAAILGGVDDFMNNVRGKKRRVRKLKQVLRLIRVHKNWKQRLWLSITLPWSMFKRTSLWLGSHPGKGLHVHERLLMQFLAGSITAWWIYYKLGESWREIHIPFDGYVNIGWWIIPLIIFCVMFTANAVNVADGMDGLAGGSLIVTFSALGILSWLGGYPEMAYLNATTAGALITYTYFNIKPARFQMGDVGSLGLGALLAFNAIVINQMLVLPFIAFLFYAELASVIIQILGRYTLGRRIFKMAPIHHHFELRGWSEEKTVMRFWIIHIGFVLLGMWIALY
ncbi:MAG: phospho-N-acetylmuramoyl-pentapeptide-transferase [Candidatus Magasanikbacteria bacterium]|mgnify:CR=1 FL=1|jgi:phospho-N-acetylmuramoyl-pentapeptide-transferase|nr:phospho-N-acetylmuramoyl-pentapeptide-transferase [Candidatus Magasanikbacteria bacterium]MBT4071516.1 phospho-N-acetylmuramoyl-pentapeptide-transferase [Candidatus Magasanikbacteria bacterium]